MQILVSFSNEDLDRLFLTYKRNFSNYQKIKSKFIGKNAALKYNKSRKSSILFFIALTFIIIVSSIFSIIGALPNSFAALWIIWSIAFILFMLWSYYNYKINNQILNKNKTFFSKFEELAKKHETLEEFKKHW
ncbi:MAG: hypothetical protein MK207_10810 [Saprospiraceae bacterium]|nr:hypothetical protein [Saprospiraceae bacterium]